MSELSEALQAAIDNRAKLYYEADIRVQQGEDPEKVAKDLGLDRITPTVIVGGGLPYTIESLIHNKIESDGRTTIQHKMSEGAEKEYLERTLSNLEKANEKKEKILKKSRNFFIVVGCVIGLFYFIGGD